MSLSFITDLPPEQQQAVLNGPALTPPDGVESNFDNPSNQTSMAVGVTIFALCISTLLMISRFYARVIVLRRVGIEDFVALAAFGTYCAYIYCVLRFANSIGYFVHQWDIQVKQLSEFLYILTIGANFYAVTIMCIKVSIMLDWIRIFVPSRTRNVFFYACWAVLIVNTTYYIANIIATNLACIPFRAIYDKTIPGKCLDEKALDSSSAAINLISDLTILILAQKVIWRLHISVKKKLGVSVVFAVGLFGTIAGCFRLAVTIQYQKEEDVTYSVCPVILWAVGEMTAGFAVFCVPMLPSAAKSIGSATQFMRSIRSMTNNSTNKQDASARYRASWHPKSSGSADSYRQVIQPAEMAMTDMPARSVESIPQNPQVTQEGIVRTTQVVTAVGGHSARSSEDEYFQRQPWDTEQPR